MAGCHALAGSGRCSGRESIADGDECRKCHQQDNCKEIGIHCDEVQNGAADPNKDEMSTLVVNRNDTSTASTSFGRLNR